MAIIKKVTVLDVSKIRLDQDAYVGDIIDFAEINQVDTTFIIKKIDEARDLEYEKRLAQVKSTYQLEKENAISQAIKEKDQRVFLLNEQLKKIEKEVADRMSMTSEKQKNDLLHKIELLEKEKQSMELDRVRAIKESVYLTETRFNDKINELNMKLNSREIEIQHNTNKATYELNRQILVLNQELQEKQRNLEHLKEVHQKDLRIAVNEKETELKEVIKEHENRISSLQLSKSALNIKKQGENLESWCNNEYQQFAVSGFETCSWEKDNKVIRDDVDAKGSKADYIFKVYASKDKKDSELLSSVVCEMKSEGPLSDNKTKNADHFKKLDNDRAKKSCEYALLVSELEWDTHNDSPIKKVLEYDKMYVIRPQYFIVFLSIITALGMKYKDILMQNNFEKAQFKDIEDILTDFENMKNEILDKSFRLLEKEITEILKNAESIQIASKKIIESTEYIIEKRLSVIRKKIEDFNIKKMNKKIDLVS